MHGSHRFLGSVYDVCSAGGRSCEYRRNSWRQVPQRQVAPSLVFWCCPVEFGVQGAFLYAIKCIHASVICSLGCNVDNSWQQKPRHQLAALLVSFTADLLKLVFWGALLDEMHLHVLCALCHYVNMSVTLDIYGSSVPFWCVLIIWYAFAILVFNLLKICSPSQSDTQLSTISTWVNPCLNNLEHWLGKNWWGDPVFKF